jgi:deoxyribonuclease V
MGTRFQAQTLTALRNLVNIEYPTNSDKTSLNLTILKICGNWLFGLVSPLTSSLSELRRIQRETAKKVVLEDRFEQPITSVAGVDLAFINETGIAACVATDYPPRKILEVQTAAIPVNFPYVPTFLTFREGPPILRAISSTKTRVNIFLINGQGLAHPLRCGLASHLGVESGHPTIGVTKNRLIGEYAHVPEGGRDAVPLTSEGEQVGWVLRSRKGSKPIFVSPGHMVSLHSSLAIVSACLAGHRLPEPIRMAHEAANYEKRRLARAMSSSRHT